MTVEADAEAYRILADAVEEHMNPTDQDAAEVEIMASAVRFAAEWIESQPCTCPPNAGPPEWEVDPCGRCQAIGRARDSRVDP